MVLDIYLLKNIDMKVLLKSRTALITTLILSLPILLHVYQPSMQLEGLGFILGFIGMTISPILLFGVLILLILSSK